GNHPNASKPLSNNEIDTLYEKEMLGPHSPDSILNTVWLNNCIHFGMRGVKEHYNLTWGDISLATT
ncbi:hypothetical protein ScPMuIL_004227, partial [Solemya velum]